MLLSLPLKHAPIHQPHVGRLVFSVSTPVTRANVGWSMVILSGWTDASGSMKIAVVGWSRLFVGSAMIESDVSVADANCYFAVVDAVEAVES